MVEISSACVHGKYERIWPKCLRVMSNLKAFAMQDRWADNGRLAGQMNMTDYLVCHSYV